MDEALLLCALLAPLIAAFIPLLLAPKVQAGVAFLTLLAAAVSFLSLLLLTGASPALQFSWLKTAGFNLTIGLRLDGLSWLMALLVTGISLLVSIYAIGDMADETSRPRFFATLSFFVSAMLALVLADSFILLFAAWEAVGVASFLLIGFWYRQEAARRAAFKAFVMTRCGDVGLLLGWLLALLLVGSTEIDALLRAADRGTIPAAMLTLLSLLFFAGAAGKSAQFPLTTWLPDAMVGPTPVSALIHSATMVAAGVYLILRLFPLFAAAPHMLVVVLTIGILTAFLAAVIAAGQRDVKRVLAWSTASQLGEMMFAAGLGNPLGAAFHLGTHAAFKSTLFLAAGAIDHGAGRRDLNRLGQLTTKMPVTTLVFCAGALALAGIPPFSGFWSEEAILAQAIATSPLLGLLLIALVFLAGVYVSRAVFAALFAWPGTVAPKGRDPGAAMTWSMVLLSIIALGLGWALAGRLEWLLQVPSSGEVGWSWRFAVISAAVTGLGFGAWRVWRYGPVPVWGALSSRLETATHAAATAPAQFVLACANKLARIEQWLDRGARVLANAVFTSAKGEERAEARLDVMGRKLALKTIGIAETIDLTETQGFSANVDHIAGLLGLAGDRLRVLQSGKVYLYTLGVFLWILSAGLFGYLAWIYAGSG
ncbi:MAG TPA: NADH-quinone oxidoreductase subunit L [Candidatus Binatia bacterium]|nr:NADH-quinone oxidoreductase subunit L [Candidatus Binatia bacterium]